MTSDSDAIYTYRPISRVDKGLPLRVGEKSRVPNDMQAKVRRWLGEGCVCVGGGGGGGVACQPVSMGPI